MRIIVSTFILILTLFAGTESRAESKAEFKPEAAWQEFSHTFQQDYAYLETSGIDVPKLISQYKTKALATQNKNEFIDVIQIFLRYFRDPHLNIGPMNIMDMMTMTSMTMTFMIHSDI